MARRRGLFSALVSILGLLLFAVPVQAAPAQPVKVHPAHLNEARGFVPHKGQQHAVTAGNPQCPQCKPPLLYSPPPAPGPEPVMGGLTGTPGSVTVVPVYWVPSGYSLNSSYRSVINGYLANVAAASRSNTNVFAVATQYYQQPPGGPLQHIHYVVAAGAEIDDAHAYPSGCVPASGYSACVTDRGLQAELKTLPGLQADDSHVYVVVFPPGVETCVTQNGVTFCSSTDYCGYHSATSATPYLIYTNEPYPGLSSCSAGQAPNGDAYADAQVSIISHEVSESITDWAGAWNDVNGYENGDECAYVYGSPVGGTSGSYYNQVIGTGHYYTQDEFSNEDYALGIGDPPTPGGSSVFGCVQKEELPVASFSGPSSVTAGIGLASFDGSASRDSDNSTAPLTYDWNWGDGSAHASGAQASHTFCSPGSYTVTLTITDSGAWQDSASSLVNALSGPPVVKGIVPASGPPKGGTPVTISGCDLSNVTSVAFGSTPASSYTVVSDTQLMATSPAAQSSGPVDVTLADPQGTSAITPADRFTYSAFIGYFSWFDNLSPGMVSDNFHLFDTGSGAAHVTLSLPGAAPVNVTVQPGTEQYVTFPAGTMGGPVTLTSDQPMLASQRVQYFSSFNEVWAMDASQESQTSYLSWFDKASTGMVADNIHVFNPGSLPASVTVTLGTASIGLSVPAGQEQYTSFPAGTIGGPVKITSDQPVLASQRVQYYQSFNEVAARGPGQAQLTTIFNWYDTATAGMVNDNIHVVNPGTSPATVWIGFPTGKQQVTVAPGAEVYASAWGNGVIGGPVPVSSNVPVLASQRVQYYQSFNEVASESQGQAAMTSHIMWFDKASVGMTNDNLHLYCWPQGGPPPPPAPCNVQVSLAGAQTISVQVASGGESYVSFPAGTIGGPVTITSDNPVGAAQRVQYYQSFNEVPAA